MDNVKICPKCGAEYYSHIEVCKSCGGVSLIWPSEKEAAEEERRQLLERSVEGGEKGPFMVVDTGSLARVTELVAALEEAGVSSGVAEEPCAEGGCAKRYMLMVPEADGERAEQAIKEYWHRAHPELAEAEEAVDRGLCPACGSVTGGAKECPDCGLTLVFVTEEEGKEG